MTTTHDLAVIGAGIVGLAVAREWLDRHPGASIVVVEKEPDVAAHQTGHNSGVVHGGIYYTPGSLKARLCVEGARRLYEYCDEHGVPYRRCGKLIVAINPSELGRLDDLEARGHANAVPGLRRVGADEIRDIEPHGTGIAALHAPNTGIVDYGEISRAMHRELLRSGVEFRFGTEVRTVTERAGRAKLTTTSSPVHARTVIACAGLWSDRIARSSGSSADPRIVPFRGEYLRLRRTAEPLVRGMIYPVPDPTLPFLGVHITSHMDDTVLLGPTAMMVPSRDGYSLGTVRWRDARESLTWPGTWKVARSYWRTGLHEMHMAASRKAFVEAAAQYAPSLTVDDLDGTTEAGVRAQALGRDGTLVDDFVIEKSGSVVHVRNAPSPAATASLAIAKEIVDRVLKP